MDQRSTAHKKTAQTKLDTLPVAARKKTSPLSSQQIREITARLGKIARRIYAVDADRKGVVCETLGITISSEHATRASTVWSRPSHPYRYGRCPRADSTTDDTAVIAQGRLGEQYPTSTASAGGLSEPLLQRHAERKRTTRRT
ncbi:hypothetical protein [Streptomyces sp. NPDC019507]|uniref:hypothetical protein n=1 Tax=Streptomyces sp. NPDC019507 TaxID=3154689 RepID=UPI0033F3C2BD